MNKISTISILSACILLVFITVTSCNKNPSNTTIATIITLPVVSAVTTTSAQVQTIVTNYGNGVLTADGVCYSTTNQSPSISDPHTSNGVDSLNFASTITGLSPNTTYYARSYATNSAGTAYGSVISFKTTTATFGITATVNTFAGSGTAGYVDGAATTAQFYNLQGICTDASGNVYVADSYNNVIRKITPLGVTSTFAGNGILGYVDGPGATAEFYNPQGLTIDASGNLYVSDIGDNIIRKVTSAGVVSTLAGRGTSGYADGTGTSAVFNKPIGLAVDASGNVYVADKGNNVIRMITPAGVVSTLAGLNTTVSQIDGTGTAATFNTPTGIAVDATGNVYVADQGNNAVRKITSGGVVTTLLGTNLLKTTLGAPTGICVDKNANIYITDTNGRILELSNNNVLYSLAGVSGSTGFTNGTNTNVKFNNPLAVAADKNGNIFITDYYNNVIRKLTIAVQP